MSEIRASSVLPARREPVTLHTDDGLDLVGELARPAGRDPVATLVFLHPLPTHGGMMDSHLLKKGTASDPGRSQGEFGAGEAERLDVAAAVSWATAAGLPRLWLVGWSFGTELALKWGAGMAVKGAILLSPALHRAGDADLDAWAASGKPLLVLVPELDDYLRPDEAPRRFARVPQAELIAVDRAKHLWVGEPSVRIVLNEIVGRVNPAAVPLPTEWKD